VEVTIFVSLSTQGQVGGFYVLVRPPFLLSGSSRHSSRCDKSFLSFSSQQSRQCPAGLKPGTLDTALSSPTFELQQAVKQRSQKIILGC